MQMFSILNKKLSEETYNILNCPIKCTSAFASNAIDMWSQDYTRPNVIAYLFYPSSVYVKLYML